MRCFKKIIIISIIIIIIIIAMATYDLKLLKEMIMKCEPLFDQAGMKVKASKCALFYEQRSGNNWYKGKDDKKLAIKVQGETIETYKRSESYKYSI